MKKIHKAYKTEIDPNNCQRTLFRKACGSSRWAYNWGLRRKIDAFKETGKSPSSMELHKELNVLKNTPKEEGGIPWMYEVSKSAPQNALRDLDQAFKNFFRRCKQGKPGKKGFPKFKKKRNPGSFRVDVVKASSSYIQIPRVGKVRLKERGYIPTENVKILSATISEQAGKWFVSVNVEIDNYYPQTTSDHVVGVDTGIKSLATTSDGISFENPKALRSHEKRLGRYQRSLSRKKKGSQNRKKAVLKVARLHARIASIRRDALHKCSLTIVKSAGKIVLEDLNVAGMVKNRRLSKVISDASMAELHRKIAYKACWRGIPVDYADRWFASSKTCSSCGNVLDQLSLSIRNWTCSACGVSHDRDVNAATNLKNTVSSTEINACGEISSGRALTGVTKLASMKQEPNAVGSL